MALPSLTSTTTSSTSSTSSKATTTITSAIVSTASDGGTTITSSYTSTQYSSSSSSYTTPAVTVPVSSDNPYISRTNSLQGTVFICFGLVVAFILIATILLYVFTSWRAKRIALLGKESNMFDNHYYYHDLEKAGPGQGPGPGPGVPGSRARSVSVASKQINAAGVGAGASDPNNDSTTDISYMSPQRQLDVTNRFISPTVQVLNARDSLNNNVFMVDSHGSPSPIRQQQHHNRFDSDVSLNSSLIAQSLQSSSPSRVARHQRGRKGKKVIPSMVLEDLLRDES